MGCTSGIRPPALSGIPRHGLHVPKARRNKDQVHPVASLLQLCPQHVPTHPLRGGGTSRHRQQNDFTQLTTMGCRNGIRNQRPQRPTEVHRTMVSRDHSGHIHPGTRTDHHADLGPYLGRLRSSPSQHKRIPTSGANPPRLHRRITIPTFIYTYQVSNNHPGDGGTTPMSSNQDPNHRDKQ